MVAFLAALLLLLWAYPDVVPLPRALKRFVLGQRELTHHILMVSGGTEPVRAAGKQLLQPLGGVQLIRAMDPQQLFVHSSSSTLKAAPPSPLAPPP